MEDQATTSSLSESSTVQKKSRLKIKKPKKLSIADYLVSKSYLITPANPKCPTPDELHEMFFLKPIVSNASIAWPFSSSVTILHMPNSELTKIDGRISFFKSLEVLNLSYNHLTELPGQHFWKELTQLQFVYLNNNNLKHLGNTLNIRYARNLSHLSLHDNPIAQLDNYRHVILNKIASLTELDGIIAADEELIDGIKSIPRFAALSENLILRTDNSLLSDAHTSAESLVLFTKAVDKETHAILSHNSPVYIIQKFVRGFLIRVCFSFLFCRVTFSL